MIKVNESASESKMLKNDSTFNTASQISLNIKGEFDAIEGYDKLIPWFESVNDQESIEVIREIISDEKNHVQLLEKILAKYDKQIPVNPD